MVDTLHYKCAQKQDSLGLSKEQPRNAGRQLWLMRDSGIYTRWGDSGEKSVLLICALDGNVIKMGVGCCHAAFSSQTLCDNVLTPHDAAPCVAKEIYLKCCE